MVRYKNGVYGYRVLWTRTTKISGRSYVHPSCSSSIGSWTTSTIPILYRYWWRNGVFILTQEKESNGWVLTRDEYVSNVPISSLVSPICSVHISTHYLQMTKLEYVNPSTTIELHIKLIYKQTHSYGIPTCETKSLRNYAPTKYNIILALFEERCIL